ncbi:lipopolysaccharide heptosyltransferase II [Mucilaginibacter pocheonensis]|uniref:lipopolysaccharide heptosyltransferase II n=1 Tax=Mucilaginibacter pocheonensis TaxID=398050 RepID=A0ABU1T598_9SPHI|nr:lipopolysaccharide heptosyltransferase II [Mucilaginibacter pocheonensis]MDR6940572.1 lipopolysaccharide heptosyltransferase II [Mucilaginibacter pocheonensis]
MKILIRLPNWLGDVVMSTAFVAAVKQLYPDAQVDVIIKKELYDIAQLIPGITQIYPFSKQEFSGLGGVYRFGKKLRHAKYDLFFNLPQSLSSAAMAWVTSAKKRIGYGKEGGFFLLTNSYKKPVKAHRVDEYISLLEQFTGKALANKQVKLNTVTQSIKRTNRVLVNFNSEASSRRMPLDKGQILLDKLTDAFTNTTFCLVGSPKEETFVNQLINGSKNPARLENYAGKTDLPGLCNLMAQSTAVLTTDSGPAHLANSVGVPVIALFGAGNEHNTAPYNKQNLTVLRYGNLPCEPCVRNTCKLYGVPRCMELLDELQIINALKSYIDHA